MIKNDPANYREMCVPHGSADEANAALDLFFDEVAAARKRHRIPNVLLTLEVRHLDAEGGEVEARASLSFGDSAHAEGLAAFALGFERAKREERTAQLEKFAADVATGKRGRR